MAEYWQQLLGAQLPKPLIGGGGVVLAEAVPVMVAVWY